jgi:parallel beta-helix repeat protein
VVEYYDGTTDSKKQTVMGGFSGSFVSPRDCEFDSSKKLFVAGQGGSYYCTIAKFDLSTGTKLKTYNDNEVTGAGYNPYYLDICVDSSDSVYAAGKIAGSAYRAKVVKFDNDLNEKWFKTPGSTNSEALSVAVDDSDNILVGVYDHSDSKTKLYKYNSAGTLQWKNESFGSENSFRINQKSIASYDGDSWIVAGYSSTKGIIYYTIDNTGSVLGDIVDTDITTDELSGEIQYDPDSEMFTSAHTDGSNARVAVRKPSASGASVIENNAITSNNLGMKLTSVENVIKYNIISGNIDGISNSAGVTAKVEFNWWGDASGPGGSGPGEGDSITVNIDYSPWLGKQLGMAPMDYITNDVIMDAVEEAFDGDTVIVKSGTYTEQIVINRALNLKGDGNPRISAPAERTTYTIPESGTVWEPIIFACGGTITGSMVSGEDTIEVNIEDIEVDGVDSAGENDFAGIMYRNIVGFIKGCNVHSTGAPAGTVVDTFGILITGSSITTVIDNTVTDFYHSGIAVFGDGKQPSEAGDRPDPHGIIDGNTINGIAGTADPNLLSEKGIYIGFFASGAIMDNTVSDCRAAEPSQGAAGILTFFGTIDAVDGNHVENCDLGIAVYYNEAGEISDNYVLENDFGFDFIGGGDNLIHHNDVEANVLSGMYVRSSGNNIHHNSFDINGDTGLFIDTSENNIVEHNKFNVNDGFGIYIYNSDSNQLSHNSANRNGMHGMTIEGSDNNNINSNRFFFNDYFGIVLKDIMDHYEGDSENLWSTVLTSDGNRVISNIAHHNGEFDLVDRSGGVSNEWSDNVYETSDPAGLAA